MGFRIPHRRAPINDEIIVWMKVLQPLSEHAVLAIQSMLNTMIVDIAANEKKVHYQQIDKHINKLSFGLIQYFKTYVQSKFEALELLFH